MSDQVTRSAGELKAFCVRALCAAGVEAGDAAVTAEVLVAADLNALAQELGL